VEIFEMFLIARRIDKVPHSFMSVYDERASSAKQEIRCGWAGCEEQYYDRYTRRKRW